MEKARVVAEKLRETVDVVPWWDLPSVRNGEHIANALLKAARSYDFALFLLTCDDTVTSRKMQVKAPRDNVIFEFGLFCGHLGRERAFAIVETTDGKPAKAPSDLLGFHFDRFEYREDPIAFKNILSRALVRIENTFHELGRRNHVLDGIVGFDYDPGEVLAVVEVRRAVLIENRDLLRGKSLGACILIKPKNGRLSGVVACSTLEDVAPLVPDDISLRTCLKALAAQLTPGTELTFCVIAAPTSVTALEGHSLEALRDAGCDIVKRCTIEIDKAPQSVKPSRANTAKPKVSFKDKKPSTQRPRRRPRK